MTDTLHAARHWWRVTLLLVATITWVIVVVPPPAQACTCVNRPLSFYANDVVVAFTGRQIDRITPEHRGENERHAVTLIFYVNRVYKGDAGRQIAVRTNWGDGDCGLNFGEGGRAALTAFDRDVGTPAALLCGSVWTEAELVEVFGEGHAPTTQGADLSHLKRNDSTVPVALIVGGIAITAAIVVAVKRRRRPAPP